MTKFVGGHGGELVHKISSWATENDVEKINRTIVRDYATKNNIHISKSLEGQIIRELRKERSSFTYIPDIEKKQMK